MLKFLEKVSGDEKLNAYILGAGFEGAYSYRSGAERGPSSIMYAFENNMEIFDRFTLNEPYEMFDFGYYEIKDINTKTPEDAIGDITKELDKMDKKFTILLGGSHSVSNAFFLHLAKKYDPNDITILQIDAHPDMRENTEDYKKGASKFDHACVMRRACELGFKTVQVGIRTISRYDNDFIKSTNRKVFEWGHGGVPSIEEIISEIKTDKVYLTFDVDGLDPAHAPATGTPIPGGLDFFYAQGLIRKLIESKELIGADIVEVAPFDDDVLTQYSAANICYNILSYKLLKDADNLKYN